MSNSVKNMAEITNQACFQNGACNLSSIKKQQVDLN